VAVDDRIRLFCALQLPEAVVAALAGWQAVHLQGAHITAGRVVPAEHLHITLAFLGSRPRSELPGIVRELAGAAAAGGPVRLRVQRYRETSSVGMLVFEDCGGGGSALVRALGAGLERIGSYRPEQRPWLPHVTVTRFRRRPGLDPRLPVLGEVDAVRAALYCSMLRPTGARYDVLESVALGGR
jgi:RNA 2',3'-cyclic 3'-phosphodiesterase